MTAPRMTSRATASPNHRAGGAFRDGSRDAVPVMVAYIPFALALGAALAATRVDLLAAWSSSWLVFAGAAQLVTVQMLDGGADAAVIVAMALVVNARHLLYSASLAPYAQGWPRRWRWLSPYFMADPVYALAITRFERTDLRQGPSERLRYYAGVASVCWIGWLVLTAAGVLLAGALPSFLPLGFAAPLTFLLLLLPMLKTRANRVAAGCAGAVALLASGLPLGLNLLAGAAAGVGAATVVGARHG